MYPIDQSVAYRIYPPTCLLSDSGFVNPRSSGQKFVDIRELCYGASDLKNRIEKAVARLVYGKVDGDRARIAVPVLYPSGAGAAVEVVLHGETCVISDMALGFSEAQMQGASDFYPECAKRSAERFGVEFEEMTMFVIRTSADRMEAAVAAVANASVNAVTAAIFKTVEEKGKNMTDQVEVVANIPNDQSVRYRIYPPAGATLNAKLVGEQMAALARIAEACCAEPPSPTAVITALTSFTLHDDGSVEFVLSILPLDKTAAETSPTDIKRRPLEENLALAGVHLGVSA